MKKIILLFLLYSLPSIAFGNIFTEVKVWDVTLKYISYEINSDVYNIQVWISEEAVNLSQLAAKYNGISAINGIFFCPEDYAECNALNYTINERFVDGEDLSFYPDTGERGVFWWDIDGSPFIHKTGDINPDMREDIYEWLWNFPILFANGQNLLENYIDNGLYDRKMQVPAPRHFICSNKEKTHIYIGRSSAVSLEWLTPALYQIGCWDALNLDAGASSHFNYNWREIAKWNRQIIDGVIIQRTSLNTQELEANVDEIILRVSRYISRYPTDSKIETLDILLAYIPKLRQDIYNKYTTYEHDANWVYTGYSIEVTSLPDLKKIYSFNVLERELKKLRAKIK